MFDAEIATTLLNRCSGATLPGESSAHLDLLREGRLMFTRQLGHVCEAEKDADSCSCLIESLLFVDGSRALRFSATGPLSGWSRWAPIEPVQISRVDVDRQDATIV